MADNNPYTNPYYQQYSQAAASGSSNPYAANPYHGSSSTTTAPRPQVANAYEYDVGVAAQQSAYVPGAAAGKAGGAGGVVPKGTKRKTVLRKGGGKLWEDQTLLEWDDSECFDGPKVVFYYYCAHRLHCMSFHLAEWFRLFVGDVSNDVTDEILSNAFSKYPTFQRARVIRDKLSSKVRSQPTTVRSMTDGLRIQAKYGFVAFSDPEDFLKAWKEMDGTSIPDCCMSS